MSDFEVNAGAHRMFFPRGWSICPPWGKVRGSILALMSIISTAQYQIWQGSKQHEPGDPILVLWVHTFCCLEPRHGVSPTQITYSVAGGLQMAFLKLDLFPKFITNCTLQKNMFPKSPKAKLGHEKPKT